MKLLLNAIQCLSCQETIVSSHRHDFKTCKCGSVSVDGGLEYTRRAFKDRNGYVERCAYVFDNSKEQGPFAGKFIIWSPGGRTNPGVAFDHRDDAEQSAKELATRVPPSDWYVAQLSHVPVVR